MPGCGDQAAPTSRSCAPSRTPSARPCGRRIASRPPRSPSPGVTSRSPSPRPSSSTRVARTRPPARRARPTPPPRPRHWRRRSALAPEEVVVLSTGVIGVPLPLDKVLAGARAAVAELSADGGDAAATAILTTDSGPKVAVAGAAGFTVGGMAKGAGMIHPRLATMLVVDHDRLPARARVRPRRSCARPSRPASTGSRSTATAPRTTRSSCSRTARAAHVARRRGLRRRARATCARTSHGRSSPTARVRRSCSRSA